MKMCVEEAGVVVTAENEPKTTCAITLTSPIMRDDNHLDGGNPQNSNPHDFHKYLLSCMHNRFATTNFFPVAYDLIFKQEKPVQIF